jgi:hypothetical protein
MRSADGVPGKLVIKVSSDAQDFILRFTKNSAGGRGSISKIATHTPAIHGHLMQHLPLN